MYRVCKGVKVCYRYDKSDESDEAVVFLHGWGTDMSAFAGAVRAMKNAGKNVLALDFPGFGKSDKPPSDWGVYDYAACTDELITSLGIKRAVLVGHSFGGRICLILSARSYAEKLVLVSAAGLKPRFNLIKWFKIRWYKLKKRLGIAYPKGGSGDYRALDKSMRSVFVRVVNTHLDKTLDSVSQPTLIVWGKSDKETPLYMAKRFRRKIRDSALILLGGGHFAYAYRSEKFHAVLRAFVLGP